jgi:hypothetical protein
MWISRPTRYGRVRRTDLIQDRAMVGQNERKACFGSSGYALLRSSVPPVHCPHPCSSAGERIKGNLMSDGVFLPSGDSFRQRVPGRWKMWVFYRHREPVHQTRNLTGEQPGSPERGERGNRGLRLIKVLPGFTWGETSFLCSHSEWMEARTGLRFF